ncbi:esterase-like activity of phytase family protein [Arthrobacter sp. I2-34]|uniref:Esterase-like activity of phytase family protein n=1 Tax=Arthrobacter hankyongi TaxID=2904801 RepID=A0ABS9L1B2_9MICC|nr:esterase-like activity of phytase family protein [Arthrobacter hankyongi]MCG2620456.1 esterase-like activity of phytase family protein [Arthrobacter hankyongi]
MPAIFRSNLSKATAGALALAVVLGTPALLAGPAEATAPASKSQTVSKQSKPAKQQPTRYFNRTATLPAYANTSAGTETVAEISTVTKDNKTVIYTDAAGGGLGFVDIRNENKPLARGYLKLGEGMSPTSVYATGKYLLAVVDASTSFSAPAGKLLVFNINNRAPVSQWKPLKTIDLGGQPDSIDVSSGGRTVVIAMENQRDEDFAPAGGEEGDLPQAPAGDLAVVDLRQKNWKARHISLSGLKGLDTPSDPEPEYVSISPDDRTVAVTLQENNGVAIVDLRTKKIRNYFSAGKATVSGIDTVEDGKIDLTGTITDVPREPDAVGWIGNKYVATANEGDWKGGTRGWSIFDARTGKVVFDAGNSFEHLAVKLGQYPEDRSENKGSEPEGLASAVFNGVPYVFVGSERANFVAVYNVSNPAKPKLVQAVPSTKGPEGLLAVPERGLLIVSSEVDSAEDQVRASVQIYKLGKRAPLFPSIESNTVKGKPIAWGALGALSADPKDARKLYTASDAAYSPSRILTISTASAPARITAELPVLKDGKPAGYDIEGLWARPDGGFWLGVEGATGAGNLLVQVDAKGNVVREIALPAEVAAAMGKQGIEGVTGYGSGANEVLYFALQRPLAGDPANTARIGQLDVASGEFGWFGYPLQTTAAAGDWIGLSEITAVDAHTLAVIERDKLNGPDAKLKSVYTVKIPDLLAATGQQLPVAGKSRAVDVLPQLKKNNGWVQEKLEGLAIGGNGRVYAMVDNDGNKDANGENVLMDLGSKRSVFGR